MIGLWHTANFLVIHGTSAEEWATRYDIEPCTHRCSSCGTVNTTTIPFACGQFRGLVAEQCCKERGSPLYCFVRDPKYGDLFSGG